jgi:hypothetical protein
MDGATVKHLIEAEAELAGAEAFANLHGIRGSRVPVEPVPVTVLLHGMEPGCARCGSCCRSARQTATSSPSTHRRGSGGLVMAKPDDRFVLVSGLTETFIDTVIGM